MINSGKLDYSECCKRDVSLYSYDNLPDVMHEHFIFGGNPVLEAKTPKLALLPRNLLSIEREVKGDLSRVGSDGGRSIIRVSQLQVRVGVVRDKRQKESKDGVQYSKELSLAP